MQNSKKFCILLISFLLGSQFVVVYDANHVPCLVGKAEKHDL